MCRIPEVHKDSLPSLLSLLSAQRAQGSLALPALPALPALLHHAHAHGLFNKEEPESEGEADDTDDIVLPDEADAAFAGPGPEHDQKPRRDDDDASRQFECRHCGKRYRWKSTLRRHENVECGGKAPAHQCPYCAYRAKQRGNLGVHIRKHHNTECRNGEVLGPRSPRIAKSYKRICTRGDLVLGRQESPRAGDYIIINKVFKVARKVTKTLGHMPPRVLSGDSDGPGVAGAAGEEALVRLGGLSWEQWSARLALPLAGGGPGARAAPPPALGEPSFTCPDCGRVYKLKSSLRNHQKWECGKEPQFQCPYCVYRAKQKMHIARHMERMHREVHLKPEQYIKQDNVDACT
ncbi:lola [Danaus plexippus plexippus]|uniref:Lola n=1 Tax=Danaus plexippus plexippus TaxID=278856 RepID=A0A212FLS6_DANPL|nr:lola [Danaus plexippus plexippus]